jgi:hypothetical protein
VIMRVFAAKAKTTQQDDAGQDDSKIVKQS